MSDTASPGPCARAEERYAMEDHNGPPDNSRQSPTALGEADLTIRPWTDVDILEFRRDHANHTATDRPCRWLATLDAATERAVLAEQERDEWKDGALEDQEHLQSAEQHYLAERQARETAEAERDGVQRISEAAQRSWNEEIARRQRAEAALATERDTSTLLVGYIRHVNECEECMPGSECVEEERLHQKLFGDPQASSQAAPHEPPQQCLDIRDRHTRVEDGAVCWFCEMPWRCDTATVLAALDRSEASQRALRQSYAALIGIFHDWRTSHGHYPGIQRCSACRAFRDAVDAALLATVAPPQADMAGRGLPATESLTRSDPGVTGWTGEADEQAATP